MSEINKAKKAANDAILEEILKERMQPVTNNKFPNRDTEDDGPLVITDGTEVNHGQSSSGNNPPIASPAGDSCIMSPLFLESGDDFEINDDDTVNENFEHRPATENVGSVTGEHQSRNVDGPILEPPRDELPYDSNVPVYIVRRNDIPIKNRNREQECVRCIKLPQSPENKRTLKPLPDGTVFFLITVFYLSEGFILFNFMQYFFNL